MANYKNGRIAWFLQTRVLKFTKMFSDILKTLLITYIKSATLNSKCTVVVVSSIAY